MSRDFNSQEWAEVILRPREQELDQLKRTLSYVQREAYYEGLTVHLRPGLQGTPFHECPFCSSEELDLHQHLITCGEVPEHLKPPEDS